MMASAVAVRASVAALALVGVFVLPAYAYRPLNYANPMTMTPHQTAAFVADDEAARLLDDVAEFAARLLLWEDTERQSAALVANQLIKGVIGPFAAEYYSGRPPKLGSDTVRDRVSAAYRGLRSPRIVALDISNEIVVGPIAPVDVTGDGAEVPVVVTNSWSTAVEFRLFAPGAGSVAHVVRLAAGETRGFFWKLELSHRQASARFIAEAHGLAREVILPVRFRDTRSVRFVALDEAGRPTPARVYARGADGRAHAPKGVTHRTVTGEYGQPFAGEPYFYTSGKFELMLPLGPAEIEVVKGMEHHPARLRFEVDDQSAGREHSLRLSRMANLARDGWHSGDNHVHLNLFGEDRVTAEEGMLIGKAEDLNVISVLPCNDPKTEKINDVRFFEGRPSALSEPQLVLYVNQEVRNNLYHHISFLNLKSLVEPAYSGWARSKHPYDNEPNHDVMRRAKAQGALAVYVHPNFPSESSVDFALGTADALETLCQNDETRTQAGWYALLNCGLRVPASAGTDCFLNIPSQLVAGACRVYVKTQPKLDYSAWVEGIRRGRTFVTNAPLLAFSVDGREPGDEIVAGPERTSVTIKASARSIVPMTSLEVVFNGDVVASAAPGSNRQQLELNATVTIAESGWLALRARGPGHRLVPNDKEVYAHTSPVYVRLGDRPSGRRSAALHQVAEIERIIERVLQQGKFETPAHLDAVVALFRRGQAIYRQIAERAER